MNRDVEFIIHAGRLIKGRAGETKLYAWKIDGSTPHLL